MKNWLFYSLFFPLTMLCAACTNANDLLNNKTSSAEPGREEAQEIIKFNNALVELDDRNNSYLDKIKSNVAKVVLKIQSPSTINYLDEPYEIPLLNNEDPTKVPASLRAADREFFKTNIALMNDVYSKIKTAYKSLYDYMQAEDYKDDDAAKGKSLVVLIDSFGIKYYSIQGLVFQKLNMVVDEAEHVIMKNHPLKDFIFAMKDDNKAVMNLNNLLDSGANNYRSCQRKAEETYGILEVQFKKHSVMILPDGYDNQKDALHRFYDAMNDYLLAVREALRNAASSGSIDDYGLQYLKQQQDALRTYYNDFVK